MRETPHRHWALPLGHSLNHSLEWLDSCSRCQEQLWPHTVTVHVPAVVRGGVRELLCVVPGVLPPDFISKEVGSWRWSTHLVTFTAVGFAQSQICDIHVHGSPVLAPFLVLSVTSAFPSCVFAYTGCRFRLLFFGVAGICCGMCPYKAVLYGIGDVCSLVGLLLASCLCQLTSSCGVQLS